ncbi:MAG TPA: Na/Pi cotransporter family protein [Kiritimatiellia bacterium]|nr:Na/Pi cotransporter family protein [Kiritimatiellia bacterium]
MDFRLFFSIVFSVVGGLGIFLIGMRFMSDGLQAVAGDRLRKLIGAVTDNRVVGLLVGLFVTCIVQSSTITTVMTVGLVNSGFMTLMQSIGVIFGANIGTTVTGWILVLDIGKYGLPILGLSAFFYLFAKRDGVRYAGMALMGVGMIFFGLELMKNGFSPLRTNEEFRAWFHAFDASNYWGILKCVLVGCILTVILQSSSATLGITMGLASAGVIPFTTAAALVLGENIGTTITAFLATLGATTAAKRTAWAHILFNTLGTVWFVILFPFMITAVVALIGHDPNSMVQAGDKETFPYILRAIALVHTGFNVTNALLFLPMAGWLAWIVERIIPDRGQKEIHRLTYLDVRNALSPALGIVQSREQIHTMAEATEKMFGYLKSIMDNPAGDAELEEKLFRREQILDQMQKEVVLFLGRLLGGEVTHEVIDEARGQIRMADEYETLSDYQANVLKGLIKLRKNELTISDEGLADLKSLHAAVSEYAHMINVAVRTDNKDIITRARADGDNVTRIMKQIRKRHLQRLSSREIAPLKSLIYMDILNHYRRMKDHAFNVAEVIAGEK